MPDRDLSSCLVASVGFSFFGSRFGVVLKCTECTFEGGGGGFNLHYATLSES